MKFEHIRLAGLFQHEGLTYLKAKHRVDYSTTSPEDSSRFGGLLLEEVVKVAARSTVYKFSDDTEVTYLAAIDPMNPYGSSRQSRGAT